MSPISRRSPRRGRRKGNGELEAQRDPLRRGRARLHGAPDLELGQLLEHSLLLHERVRLEAARVDRRERRCHEDERQGGDPCKLNEPLHGARPGRCCPHAPPLHQFRLR